MASQRKSQLKRTQLITPIEKRIFILRGERIMLSFDIAALYGIEPKALVQAVKRNIDRFPEDFMFQLTAEEFQNGIRRARPYAFTEQGVAMLSSVLRSTRAVQVNVAIMRAFVRLRTMLVGHEELTRLTNSRRNMMHNSK